MRNMDIQDFDPYSIPDIRDINIDSDQPVLDKTLDYIIKAKNPYFIRCGKILVKLEFPETETKIEDCMEGFIRSLF